MLYRHVKFDTGFIFAYVSYNFLLLTDVFKLEGEITIKLFVWRQVGSQ